MVEHLAIEEEKGTESPVLCRSGNVSLEGQVGEKGFDPRSAHFGRVTYVVAVDVALDTADVGLLRAIGIVFALSCDSTGGGWVRGPDPIVTWDGALP